jgi:hypothetical protein
MLAQAPGGKAEQERRRSRRLTATAGPNKQLGSLPGNLGSQEKRRPGKAEVRLSDLILLTAVRTLATVLRNEQLWLVALTTTAGFPGLVAMCRRKGKGPMVTP